MITLEKKHVEDNQSHTKWPTEFDEVIAQVIIAMMIWSEIKISCNSVYIS
jgi:hypothetical protein